ncbi:ABC transporter ATP-binding protein [Frigidibacter oleivorans]|uniref:ABC transporter ATP-binding protein n=1 Tax=Frigidibacter oleivorans TaxID=2487129 RepID=UPI000F8E4EC6|nr:ABC transporter ATP-binding protein [Frigidibacter oleivorans]
MTLLALDRLSVTRAGRPVLEGATLTIGAGEVVGLIGPNGAGKTTLLRAALGLIPAKGHASLAALPPARRARAAAFLPQQRDIAWPMPVAAVVALGRVAHAGSAGPADRAAVERALAAMGLADLAARPATELSGGEQARVLIARVLAQEAPLILADEPVAGLDPAQQIATMQVFAAHAAAGGAVLASLHDLGLAARHCTRLVMMQAGRIVADGPPAAVLTGAHLARVFGIRAQLSEGPDGPLFQTLGLL